MAELNLKPLEQESLNVGELPNEINDQLREIELNVDKPIIPPPSFNLTGTAKPAMLRAVSRPKTAVAFDTRDITNETSKFHFLIYAETNMRKTSIAAKFGDPKSTLIILTRNKEQVLPLRDMGYKILHCPDASVLRYALQNPEYEWETIHRKNDPSLRPLEYVLVDDTTEAVNMLVEDGDSPDNRKNYNDAGKDLRTMLKLLRAKGTHVGLIALARIKENQITNKERISIDLPPSMLGMIGAEIEYCFYVEPETYNLLTDREWTSYTEEVEGKKKAYKVEIFAKSKEALDANGNVRVPPVLSKKEKPDLKAIWGKIQASGQTGPITKAIVRPVVPSRTGTVVMGGKR